MTSRRATYCLRGLACGLALWATATATAAADSSEPFPEGARVMGLAVEPSQIELNGPFAYRQLIVTAQLEDGSQLDLTRRVAVQPSELVTVSATGLVRAAADGQGELAVAYGDVAIGIPLRVTGVDEPYQVSFVRDVMPAMSKMGCNSGTCHGAQDGKNGFKLSLRGYDPLFDHRALTDDLAGRRFNRSAPEQSLMLLKPIGGVPHVGGVRTRIGESHYEILRRWIAGGVELDLESPRVVNIELSPVDPQIHLPGMQQQMAVLATYSDGTVRDVTADAFIESSLGEVAEANDRGLITAVRRGEAAVLARFEGAYAATTITVLGDRTGFQWRQPEEHNYIDTLVYDKLRRVQVLPSELASDAEFLRRIYLDLTGLPPDPATVREFLADGWDTRIKRQERIDRLVGSPAFVEHWTNKWADLLQVNGKFLTQKGAWALRRWIRHAIETNQPYDEFVYQLLTGSGSTFENPPAAYYRVLRTPEDAMENTTQLFLGIRFNCNKCHDHPFERWTQDQYYNLAAYFAHVGRRPGPSPQEEVVYDVRSGGEVVHARTGQVSPPEFPYEYEGLDAESDSRREALARWLTSRDNPYFARSFVNRVWSYLLGAGLIEPVDDIRAGNPPSNPELLDRLTREFVDSGFDFQLLVRTICQSRVYQQSVATNRWNEDDEINFSHAMARRLPAETLYDAVKAATGSRSKLPGVPEGHRAAQLADATVAMADNFLDLFGRPPRESACECERSSGVMLSQALNLVNGPTIAEAIADSNNRITKAVAAIDDDGEVVDELFVSILSRPPTAAERATGIEAIRSAESRLIGAQDLAWALINSPAFLFNY